MANHVAPFLRGDSYSVSTQIEELPYLVKLTLHAMCPKCQHECIFGGFERPNALLVKCKNPACDFKATHEGITCQQVEKAAMKKLSS